MEQSNATHDCGAAAGTSGIKSFSCKLMNDGWLDMCMSDAEGVFARR